MHRIIKSHRARDAGIYTIKLQDPAAPSDVKSIGSNGLQEQPKGQVMKVSPIQEGEKVLEEARQKAGEILEEARAKGGVLQSEAVARGLEQVNREKEKILREAGDLMAMAVELRREMLRSAEPQVVELALKVAGSILKTSTLVEGHLIKDIVAEAITLLAGEESIIVKVNPGDLNLCRAHKEYFRELLTEDATIRFLPSEDLDKGCCIVQGQFARVESLLEERFNVLAEKLLEETKNAQGSEPPKADG